DGIGESEIICLWLTQREDKDTLTCLVDHFKKHNENWLLVRCVISDKDITV
uniref:ZSWIM1/3 RNaseH-like domain-containing protein n=1 Tax=Amphimedon queenslandica TaxID=400682 RepID=A0A1X7V6J8_AMPQE